MRAWNDSEYEHSWRKESEKHRRGNVKREVLSREIELLPMEPTVTEADNLPQIVPIPVEEMEKWDREESEWIRRVGDDF